MSQVAVFTKDAPPPRVGVYSQAISAGGFVYCSGSIPAEPGTGVMIGGDIKAHTVRNPSLLSPLPLEHQLPNLEFQLT